MCAPQKYQPSKVISILNSSIREHEHKNEVSSITSCKHKRYTNLLKFQQLAEEFLRKKISVDDFLEDYLTDRKVNSFFTLASATFTFALF